MDDTPEASLSLTSPAVRPPDESVEGDELVAESRTRMIRNNRFKLVVRERGMNELYDLELDPRQEKNLWNDPLYTESRDQLLALAKNWAPDFSVPPG